MFGQKPRSDSDFWKFVRENEIQDEEDLPTPVDATIDEIIDGTVVETIDETLDTMGQERVEVTVSGTLDDEQENESESHDDDHLQALSDDIRSHSTTDMPPLETSTSRHDHVRAIATTNYLATATRKITKYQESLSASIGKYSLSDCVGV